MKQDFIKILLLFFITVLFVTVLIVIVTNNNSKINTVNKTNNDYELNNIYNLKFTKNDNIVFAGDSLIKNYDLNLFYEQIPTVNTGEEDETTDSLLENIEKKINIYNPTIVIIGIGLNDLKNGKNVDETYSNIIKITNKIKDKRKKTNIYVLSLIEINNIDNNDIELINKKLSNYYNDNYIDINSHINNKDILNEEDYIKITSIIRYQLIGKETKDNIYNLQIEKDDNYVFIGDSITELYPVNDYFDNIPIVNKGVGGFTTTSILDDMDNLVYKYNPSKVFLTIGINDMSDTDRTKDEIFENIKKIVSEIKKNRPNTKIYVESIYPINTSDDPKINRKSVEARSLDEIKYINNKLKDEYKNTDIKFIDVYSELLDENGLLKIDYTKDGVHFTISGYNKVTSVLLKYIAE